MRSGRARGWIRVYYLCVCAKEMFVFVRGNSVFHGLEKQFPLDLAPATNITVLRRKVICRIVVPIHLRPCSNWL